MMCPTSLHVQMYIWSLETLIAKNHNPSKKITFFRRHLLFLTEHRSMKLCKRWLRNHCIHTTSNHWLLTWLNWFLNKSESKQKLTPGLSDDHLQSSQSMTLTVPSHWSKSLWFSLSGLNQSWTDQFLVSNWYLLPVTFVVLMTVSERKVYYWR